MDYKYQCVIDKDSFYKEFVLVFIAEEIETVQHYELQEGEVLIDSGRPPLMKIHAESNGFIKSKWNGSEWVEGATDEEIEQWNAENPAPEPIEPEPSTDEILNALLGVE